VPERIRRILFPTDFSPESTKAFRQTLKWARRFKASVTIYNLLEAPVPFAAYDFGYGGADPRLIQLAMDSAEESCRESGDKLVLGARKLGVPCEFVLETKHGLPEDGILKQAAKTGANLIVLTSSRGPLSQRVFGRVTKDVLSRSTRPVITVKV
jgi:nucleotide-binding universal stress UspA family protein